jgi:hypothetical protein
LVAGKGQGGKEWQSSVDVFIEYVT